MAALIGAFGRLLRWSWYGLAFGLISAAVLLTLARVWLPAADDIRAQLQSWASTQLNQPVRIGTLDARLLGTTFTLVLDRVELLSEPGGPPIARFGEARLELNVIESLRMRRAVVDGLTIVGADLTVERREDGSLRVRGLGRSSDGQAASGTGRFGSWLLAQPRLALRESSVRWIDRDLLPDGDQMFADVDIMLRNRPDRHQLTGTLKLPEPMGRTFNVAVDVRGDVTRSGGWNAQGYLGATGVEPGSWWLRPRWRGVAVRQGKLDLNLWGTWRNARLTEISGETALRDVVLEGDGQQVFDMPHASAQFRWSDTSAGWSLDVADFRLERPGHAWEPARIRVERNGHNLRLLADYLHLGDAGALAGLGSWLQASQKEALTRLAPTGAARAVRLDLGGSGVRFQSRLGGLAVRPWRTFPGVEGLDGSVRWDSAGGEVRIESANTRLSHPRLFRNDLLFRSLAGTVRIRPDVAGGWHVSADGLEARTPDISARLAMDLHMPAEGAPFLDLRGDFSGGRAVAVPTYLPARIMRPKAVAWLDRAFRAGRITRGGLVYHGRVDRFPFMSRDGVFQVDFRVEGMTLDYREGWPAITDLAGNVVFAGMGMDITAQGAIYDSRLHNVRVAIPNLKIPVLTANGRAAGDLSDSLRFLSETPLAARFGSILPEIKGRGPASTHLSLRLPLHRAADTGFALEGATDINDAAVAFGGTGLRLKDLGGKVTFTQDRIETDGLDGTLFRRPVRITSRAFTGSGQEYSRIELVGSGTGRAMADSLGWPLLARLGGEPQWRAELTVPHRRDFAGSAMHVRTSLEGIPVDLPAPLGKPAERALPTDITIQLSGKRKGEIAFDYGDALAGRVAIGDKGLRRGAIHFGDALPELPLSDELRVTGSLEGFDAADWAPLFDSDRPSGWKLPPLEIRMDRLHLAVDEEEVEVEVEAKHAPGNDGWLRQISTLQIDIKDLGYGKKEFDGFVVEAEPVPGGLHFRNLRLSGDAMQLDGQGDWHYALGRSRTSFRLHLKSDDTGRMIRSLGYQTGLEKGRLTADGDLTWTGTPADFSLAGLGGQVKLKVRDGTLENVDPGAGRLLGLFSIDALPRRLFLDFRDLFERGYRFEQMEGTIAFKGGNAHTDDLRLSGQSAGILITGRTGLTSRDYDQMVTVLPNVADTLPVAGGLVGGLQVGALLLLVRKIFKSELQQIARYRYRITGTWDDPVVQRLKPEGIDAPYQ